MRVEEAGVVLFDKLFEKFGYNYKNMTQKKWEKLEWTEEEHTKFMDWGIGFLRKKMRWTKAMAMREMGWFMLKYSPKFKETKRGK